MLSLKLASNVEAPHIHRVAFGSAGAVCSRRARGLERTSPGCSQSSNKSASQSQNWMNASMLLMDAVIAMRWSFSVLLHKGPVRKPQRRPTSAADAALRYREEVWNCSLARLIS